LSTILEHLREKVTHNVQILTTNRSDRGDEKTDFEDKLYSLYPSVPFLPLKASQARFQTARMTFGGQSLYFLWYTI
jgi:hypothetical protein